ncbi:hypothetical protein Pdw03_5896 [Penicillium digitatum]|uniref:Uncharacterized protein n=1 Tax=Penicillium digitatum TaxID=36651 RepID=A0A7T7BQL0_PENDI|nr:hypothetical protein Pdw03_5896 [Penicillium digitatum]
MPKSLDLVQAFKQGYSFDLREETMRCLWRIFAWPKGWKSEDEGGQQLETFDRATLVQSLERSQLSGIQDTRLTPGFQERYVRFGIGGAGNMRKSCFPFLGVHGLSNLLYLELTDIIFLKQSTFS